MPPKTSRRVMSRGVIERLRQSIAQRFAATALGGAPDHEAAPPPLKLQPIMAPAPSTQQSSVASTSTTGRSFPRSIRCKSGRMSTSTSASTRTRGIVVGNKTHKEVRKHERMKAVRASEKKVDHRSGLTPFAYRAKKLKKSGNEAPISNLEIYKNAPDAAVAMTAAVEASIAFFEASNPTPLPVEGGSNSIPPAPITLPVETHIDIVQGEVGVRRGMVIRSLGVGSRRDPQPRGGTQTSGLSSEVEELRSTVARMQQEREREAEEMRRFMAEQQRAMEEMQAQVRLLLRGNASGGEFTSNQQS